MMERTRERVLKNQYLNIITMSWPDWFAHI